MRKNKYKALITVLLILCVIAFTSGCSSKAEASNEEVKNISLNFATFWPGENFYVTEGHNAWTNAIKERVESETDYTIEFAMYPGGALLGATEIYEGVANGAADIGSTCPSYTPGVFPATSAFELPGFINDNAVVASMAIQEAYMTVPEISNEYKDVKVMHFWATGPGDLLTKDPVRTLEDLQGMEIRVASGSVPAMEALGAAPVTMPMGDAYLALNQGIVNGILGPDEILRGFRLAEVTNSITKTPFLYNTVFVKVMNLDTWNSLPPEVQKIFEEVNEEFVYNYAELGKKQSLSGETLAVEEYGHEIISLSADEEARWVEALAGVQSQWIQEIAKTGLDSEGILKKAHQLDEKYSQLYGSAK